MCLLKLSIFQKFQGINFSILLWETFSKPFKFLNPASSTSVRCISKKNVMHNKTMVMSMQQAQEQNVLRALWDAWLNDFCLSFTDRGKNIQRSKGCKAFNITIFRIFFQAAWTVPTPKQYGGVLCHKPGNLKWNSRSGRISSKHSMSYSNKSPQISGVYNLKCSSSYSDLFNLKEKNIINHRWTESTCWFIKTLL